MGQILLYISLSDCCQSRDIHDSVGLILTSILWNPLIKIYSTLRKLLRVQSVISVNGYYIGVYELIFNCYTNKF